MIIIKNLVDIIIGIIVIIKSYLKLNDNSCWNSDRPVAIFSQLLHLCQVVNL